MTEVVTVEKPPFELSFDGGFIGDSCSTDAPCSDAFECVTRFDDGSGAFPGGYCSAPCPKHTCFDHPDYPWSRCVSLPTLNTPACMIECRSNTDCREGYSCSSLMKSNRDGERYVCVPTEEAARAALRQLSVRQDGQQPGGDGPPSPTLSARQQEVESSELIRFDDNTTEAPTAGASAQADRSETGSSWLLPAGIALGALTVFLLAVLWRRRRLSSRSSDHDAKRTKTGGRTRPGTDASEPLATSTSAIRPKRASRPLVGNLTGSNERGDRARVHHMPPGDDSQTGPPQAENGSTVVRGSISPVEPSANPPAADSENKTSEATPSDAERQLDRRLPRTQHLVPSLRPKDSEKSERPTPLAEQAADMSPGRSAWKAKRISHPTSDGFASADFSPRESLASPSALTPPVEMDVCLHVLDRVLQEANTFRVQRGYEDILFIDNHPEHVVAQLVDDHQVRVGLPDRSLVKSTLATDRVRNQSFASGTAPSDAHLLSVVKLGAYLLGVDADPANFQSIPLLATYAESSSAAVEQLIQRLSESGPASAPEEGDPSAPFGDGLRDLYRVTRQSAQDLRRTIERLRLARGEEELLTDLSCPVCAAEIDEGNLACRACGVPLHPRPFYCPECGRRNLLVADGRRQNCVNDACGIDITRFVPAGESERRRMSIVFSVLSRFEDFRRLRPIAQEDRFAAVVDDETVHLVEARDTKSSIVLESERGDRRFPRSVTLPTRVVDQGGLRFVLYDVILDEALPIRSLGALRLAESLFQLLDELREPERSIARLTFDDFALRPDASCSVRYGHRLVAHGDTVDLTLQSEFAAPELRMGAPATALSDIYSAAAIWYATCRGVVYAGEELPAEVPDDLLIEPYAWTVLRRCLTSDPTSRPASAAQVLSSLRNEKTLSDLI